VSVRDWGFPRGGSRYFRDERAGYGRGGYGHERGYGGGSGWNAYRNQPGYNRGGGQFPAARPGGGYNHGNQGGHDRGTNFPVARPGQGGEGRYLGGSNRGSLGYNGGSGRGFMGYGTRPSAPGQYAFNHGPSPAPLGGPQPYRGNPQLFANRGQGYGYGSQRYSRPPQVSNYGHAPLGAGSNPRPTPGFGGSQSYRVPSQTYRAPTPSFGHGFSGPSNHGYGGSYGQSGHSSGGFHPFGGGGHNSSPSFGGGGSHSFGGF